MKEKMMKTKRLRSTFLYIATIGVSILFLFFFICCSWIGYDVKSNCRDARAEYDGNCVQALISLMQDTNRSFRARNSAIWSLGQIGDVNALPSLKKMYTGNIPDRESLNEVISQYELSKAIKLLEGGANITAIFWRHGIK